MKITSLVPLLILTWHMNASAEWVVKKNVDSMTDEVRKSAYIINNTGNSFSIYRIKNNGEVWGNFSLSDKVFEQVDFRKPPIFRVDKNGPFNLERLKKMQDMGLGINAYEWEPKWVNFLMWHGKEAEGISNELKNIMTGKNIVFRYYLSTGGYKETTFSLTGAGKAISTALGITYEPSQEDIIKQQIDSKLLGFHKKCRDKYKKHDSAQKCISHATDCRDKAIKALNTSVFNKCMKLK